MNRRVFLAATIPTLLTACAGLHGGLPAPGPGGIRADSPGGDASSRSRLGSDDFLRRATERHLEIHRRFLEWSRQLRLEREARARRRRREQRQREARARRQLH